MNTASVQTAERGMQVLRAFRCDRAALSNAELVRRTGLSKATVSRLTSTLLQLGFLRHVPGGRAFELGAASLGLGHAYVASCELLRVADPLLQTLADRLDVSVALAVADSFDMLYLGYKVGHKVQTLRLGVGSVLPMGTTAIGHAYLWGLSAAQRKERIAALRQHAGGRAVVQERGIRKSFEALDEGGCCAVLAGYQRDAWGVAVPVFIGRQRTVMALSCGKADVQPDLEAERKRIGPVLRKAAVQLEQLLSGYEGEP